MGAACGIGRPLVYGMTSISPCSIGEAWPTRSIGHGPRSTQEPSRRRGGQHTGPNPTDRGQSGSKRHLVVDGRGVPLAIRHTGANVHDSQMLEPMSDAVPAMLRPHGRPRKRPQKLHADTGYDYPRCHRALKQRHMISRMARRGIDSSTRLGRDRWVVERTLSWLNRYRRLKGRDERREDLPQAFLTLGSALICWKCIERFC